MKPPKRVDRVVAKGPFGTVEYCIRSCCTLEARDWLAGLPSSVRGGFDALFKRLLEHGRIFDKTKFRNIGDQVWEFKKRQGAGYRLFCVHQGNRWLLTHGTVKPGDKRLPIERDHANLIFDEHVAFESAESRREKRNK
ncbi:type II toxin-antitoxin system RelE/ParE family toxin [Planctomicrobium sp. SH664]|uniref:type II toxin-antitoxin system RelE/ParE family toxin n=1 Tax=Planctomicrobium sp. SH664 TaxID=3448125 RepID=UPI003F5C2634